MLKVIWNRRMLGDADTCLAHYVWIESVLTKKYYSSPVTGEDEFLGERARGNSGPRFWQRSFQPSSSRFDTHPNHLRTVDDYFHRFFHLHRTISCYLEPSPAHGQRTDPDSTR